MKQTLENNPLKEKALTDRDLGSLYRGKALITQFAGRRSNEWKMRVDSLMNDYPGNWDGLQKKPT
jgi:hypothetical protein